MSELRAVEIRNPSEIASAAAEQAVPFSIEAEQQLLGALLTNNEVYDHVSRIIGPKHFYDPVHRRIYEISAERIAKNPSHCLRMAKRLLAESRTGSLESTLAMAAAMQPLAHRDPEHQARIEKWRSP